MKNFSILFVFLLVATVTFGQKYSIKGQVIDSLSSTLPSATVMLMNPKDSTLVNFGVSNTDGLFEIKNVNKGDYLLRISFVGYSTFNKLISTPTEGQVLELGKLKMVSATSALKEIMVTADKDPVVVKRDTIEFNASSFKTKTNGTVEDLLKVMPGMEVEKDGTVRAQGEEVKRVTVDGREFFGRDPKLATRNLPADAINKVQVFDKLSDQAQFTGVDDGQREKTINLELKEEKRKGAFGNLSGGLGTDNRFTANASINRFAKTQQLSFLGMANNINEQGFSTGDFMNFSGGAGGLGSGTQTITIRSDGGGGGPSMNLGGRPSGIMTNYAGGLNFNRDLNKDTKITSSYFYNHLDRDINSALTRINTLPDVGEYNYEQVSQQSSTSDNHRGNFTLDHTIDSANVIRATANATYTTSQQDTKSVSRTMTIGNTGVQNESERVTYNDQTVGNLNASFLWRHRFAKKGRSMSASLNTTLSSTESEGGQNSDNTYYSDTEENQTIEQINSQTTTNQVYGASVSYTEPLGGRKYLEANYNFQTNANKVDREVYDVDSGTPEFNTGLSNKYNSNYIYNRPGINFKMNRDKSSLTAGVSYQMTRLKGDLLLHDVSIDRTFSNVLPSLHYNYDFSSTRHLRVDYVTSMQEPTIQQLQPIIDNSDPLNISMGNPTLQPAYLHRLNANFMSFNPARFINMFAFVTGTYTHNAITNSQTVNDSLVRVTQPVNVDYSKSLSANFNIGVPVKKINSRFNIGPTARLSENITMLNEQENTAKSRTVGGTARYNFSFKDFIIFDLSGNWSHQRTTYDFSTPDQEYFNQTYTAELNLNFLKYYAFNTVYDYFIYSSTTTDFRQTAKFLNISVSRFVLKNNAGEVKLSVNNLLDQDYNVAQTTGENYIQQQTTNNLGRYYMVSFTYILNKHLNPMAGMGGRRGGMRMIIRD